MADSNALSDLTRRLADAAVSLEELAASAERLRSTNEAVVGTSEAIAELARSLASNADALLSAARTLETLDLDSLNRRLQDGAEHLDRVEAKLGGLTEAHRASFETGMRTTNRVQLIAAAGLIVGLVAIVVQLVGG